MNSDLLTRHIRLAHDGISEPAHGAVSCSPDHDGYGTEAAQAGTNNELLGSGSQNQRPSIEEVEEPQTESTSRGNDDLTFQEPATGQSTALPVTLPANTLDMQSVQQNNTLGDFDLFIDSMNGTYGTDLSSFSIGQPPWPFCPPSLFPAAESQPRLHSSDAHSSGVTVESTTAPHLFDEHASTLSSSEPSFKTQKEPWKLTQQDWDHLLSKVQVFTSIIPQGFFLPSRHTMTRYITTYFTGFHRHLPFLHVPTFSGVDCPVELILAMATIGAQSAFDHDNAVMLFRASLAIAEERLHHRKEMRRRMIYRTNRSTSRQSQTGDALPETPPATRPGKFDSNAKEEQTPDHLDPLPLAQTLLINMAMATWGNSEAIFDEAVRIQNILANFLRAEKFLETRQLRDLSWKTQVRHEGFKRTIAVIFCFFNFHTIVYDIPPPILNSELNIFLPWREKDWEASSEEAWKAARSEHEPEWHFLTLYPLLFEGLEDSYDWHCSSLGNYTVILALIQHIYFLRSATKYELEEIEDDKAVPISPDDMAKVEQALRNWQSLWNRDPESFLGPSSPFGPISFNSTALLRMAYIRLNVDLGPWRALNTHDPEEVAMSIHRSPPLTRSRELTRAVLYSAHALSIPINIGVNIVTHNQAFSWSLQHSLCALECAFIISKWLTTIEPHISEGTADEEEARLYTYIVDMVTEAKAGGGLELRGSSLCTGPVRIWARILSGKAVWNVVRMIEKVLTAYAEILERQPDVTS